MSERTGDNGDNGDRKQRARTTSIEHQVSSTRELTHYVCVYNARVRAIQVRLIYTHAGHGTLSPDRPEVRNVVQRQAVSESI